MEILGWICTILVLIGYILNANGKLKPALFIWSIGDIGWVTYDIFIDNWSHASLSFTIICINVYGMYRAIKTKRDGKVTLGKQV